MRIIGFLIASLLVAGAAMVTLGQEAAQKPASDQVDAKAIEADLKELQSRLNKTREAESQRQIEQFRAAQADREKREADFAERIKTLKTERLGLLTNVYDKTKAQYDASMVEIDVLLNEEAAMADAEIALEGSPVKSLKRLHALTDSLEASAQQDTGLETDFLKVKAQYLKRTIDNLERIQEFNHWGPFRKK